MMVIKRNRGDMLSILMEKKEIQNLLHITTLCSKQIDILSCCLVGQTTTYILDISLHYSTTLR